MTAPHEPTRRVEDASNGTARTASSLGALAVLIVLSLAAAACAAAGGDSTPAREASAAPSPPESTERSSPDASRHGPIVDQSYAELATDGKTALWMAVSGYRRDGSFALRVYRKAGPRWVAVAAPPGQVSGDLAISIVVPGGSFGSSPCLGYSVGSNRRPVIVCLSGGDWEAVELPAEETGELVQLGSRDGHLVALLARQSRAAPPHYLLLRENQEDWESSPRIPVSQAIVQLAAEAGAGDPSNGPAVGVATQGRESARSVFALRGERWHRRGPSIGKGGVGPMIGGPVILSHRILYPVNEADSEPWTFSVYAVRVGSSAHKATRLSSGSGNAQGRLSLADGTAWATWQQDRARKGGNFDASIYAAELTPGGAVRQKVELWHGVSIGPGSTQVIGYRGRTLALYMRSGRDGKGLRAVVRRLP